MNIGKNIKKIREDNSISQEQFGKIFFVTRQTVSNWENEKSYPDLNTIVKISDEFGISLDKLLKEDPEMVNTISEAAVSGIKWKMPRRMIIFSACILTGCAVIAASVWGAVWHSRKEKLETHFSEAAAELGFGLTENGIYRMRENGAVYCLPNQKMPSYWDFTLGFHNEVVSCYFRQDGMMYTITYSGDDISALEIRDNKADEHKYTYIELNESGEPSKPGQADDEDYIAAAEKVSEVFAGCREYYDKVYI